MFEQEVQRILDYVARGINVRIVGASGSGRTTVARRVAADLEKTGASVYFIAGLRTHRRVPFAGINAVGLDLRVRTLGVLGVSDFLAAQMSNPGRHVVIVDDIEFVDNESLAVLEAVLIRTGRPMVVTMRDSRLYSKSQLGVLGQGAEAHVQLNPLRYEQVSELIIQALGAPADADATARVLTKSAGNPRLVVRIAETATLSSRLELRNGRWTMTGDTLWNEHLRGTVESLLDGLDTEEVTALHMMALTGTAPLEALQNVIKPVVFDSLERQGFVSLMEDRHRSITAAINPPVVADFFRGHNGTSSGPHILRKKIAHILDALPQRPNGDANAADALMRALRELRAESGNDDAATARHFNERTHSRGHALYEQWEADKSLANAARLLRTYWGSPFDTRRIESVLGQTCTSRGEPGDILFFAVTKALWAVHSGQDANVEADSLGELGRQHPTLEAEAQAAALFLRATYDCLPSDVDAVLARMAGGTGTHGFLAAVQGLVELYRFNPSAALASLEPTASYNIEPFPRIKPFVQGLALFASGRVEESIMYALERRAEARRTLDQFGMVTSSYVAALGLVHCGHSDEAEYLMNGVFAMGRPGFLIDSLYDAMLRLAAMRSAMAVDSPSATLADHAHRGTPDMGPLPGTGKAVYELATNRVVQPDMFDLEAASIIERQLDRGYVLEAVRSALLFICLLPSRRVLDLLRSALKPNGATSHDQLVAIAGAIVEGDHHLLGVLLKHYELDSDLHLLGMLLRGAFKRYVLSGNPLSAAAMDQAFDHFAARFPSLSQIRAFNATQYLPLTVREIEVAGLAGHRTNMEIAEHLGISARTVEHHISNALRKTGTTTRNSLFELVRSSYPATSPPPSS